jgi:hypothetical protein
MSNLLKNCTVAVALLGITEKAEASLSNPMKVLQEQRKDANRAGALDPAERAQIEREFREMVGFFKFLYQKALQRARK